MCVCLCVLCAREKEVVIVYGSRREREVMCVYGSGRVGLGAMDVGSCIHVDHSKEFQVLGGLLSSTRLK